MPRTLSQVIKYCMFSSFLDGPDSLQLSLLSSNPYQSHALVVAALLQSPKIQQNVKCLNKYHLSICPLSEMTANLISRQKVWNIPC